MQRNNFLTVPLNKKRTFSDFEWISVFFLFLMSMNFLNRFIYIAYFAVAFFLLRGKKILLPRILLFTILLAVSICLFSPYSNSLNGILKPFIFPLCVLLGYNLSNRQSLDETEKASRIIVVFLALGAYVHFFANMVLNWGVADQRSTTDIWRHDVLAATGQAALSCMIIGIAFAVFFNEGSKFAKLLMALILVSVLHYNLTLASRTLFALVFIALIFALLLKLIMEERTTKRFKILLFTVLGIIAVFVVLNTKWFAGIFEDTIFYDRFFGQNAYDTIQNDNRTELKLQYLKYLFDYPWGGLHIRPIVGAYAHDVLLDTYDEAGVFAFLAVFVMLVDTVIKLVKISKNKKFSNITRLMIVCVMVVILVEFMVEPILEGFSWLFASFCVIYGALSQLCVKASVEKQKMEALEK